MMPEIGVRELKIKASEIIRRVTENRKRYVVTRRGRPVAAIIPIDEAPSTEQNESSAWDELVALGEAICQDWKSDKSSTDLLSDMRR
jgi:prevent-host-death family protein